MVDTILIVIIITKKKNNNKNNNIDKQNVVLGTLQVVQIIKIPKKVLFRKYFYLHCVLN